MAKDDNKKSLSKKYVRKLAEIYGEESLERALKETKKYQKNASEHLERIEKNINPYSKKLNKIFIDKTKSSRENFKFFRASRRLIKGLNYADLAKEFHEDYKKYGLTKALLIHVPAEWLGHMGGPLTRIATAVPLEGLKSLTREMDSWEEMQDFFKEIANRFQDISNQLAKSFEGFNNFDLSIDTDNFKKSLNNFNSQVAELPEQLIIILKIIEQRKIDAAEAAKEEAEEAGVYVDDIEDIEDIDIPDYGDTGEVLDVYGEIVDTDSGDYGPNGGNSFNSEFLSFASGGIVPGDSSQPVPVMAHGSEMILNSDQQANLVSRLKIRERFGDGEIFVYSPVIDAGNTREELMNALNRSTVEFLSIVAEKEAQRKLKMA